jgi:bla regulator protein blaR1
MLAWMIYAVIVAIALGAAAIIAEQAARRRRKSTRWPWMWAIAVSVVLPVAMATVSLPLPALPGTAAPVASGAPRAAVALRDTTTIPLASRLIEWSGTKPYTRSTQVNRFLWDIWLASSVTLVLFLSISTASFHRRKRTWRSGQLCGTPVLVSDSVGPAVVGLIRSRIVIPAWVMEEPPEQQRYVLAHEQSHLKARDPLMVAAAVALLLSMPWNPVLWWQFHRLRCAIEVDCDARVLLGGGDVGSYCETLIQVGENQSEYAPTITAMSESMSFLETRIRLMLAKPQKWARASAFILVSIALGVAAFAAQITPPGEHASTKGATVAVDAAILDSYMGTYELSDISSITIRRKGDALTVEPIGQAAAAGVINVTTLSETHFYVEPVDATLDFVKGPDQRVDTVVVHVHGQPFAKAPRVSEATANGIRESLAARVKNQTPYPGSEKALLRVLSNREDNEGMSPMAAPFDQYTHDSLVGYYAKLGPVTSYRFNGVTDYGWDSYDVQHQNGAQQAFLMLDKDGLIVSAFVRRQ